MAFLRRVVQLGLIGLLANATPLPQVTLKGVSIQNSPYAYYKNGKIEGMVVDLMNKIGEKAAFQYTLYFSPDGRYGNKMGDKITGMIGEVHEKKADFAVADLTITEGRKEWVDFTTPFMTLQLAALIRREDAANISTLEDLVKKNNAIDSIPEKISYGSITSGATIYQLSKSTDLVGQSIFKWFQAHPKSMVNSMSLGLEHVNKGKYALIVESTFAEFIAGQNCNLTILKDDCGLYQREYAIALPKGSQWLEPFNKAIKELQTEGTIEQLKKIHWENNCAAKKTKTSSTETLNEFDTTPNVDGFNV